MTTLTNWISPETMQSLGWALLHFLWQGTALAAVAGGAIAMARRPATRYLIGIGALRGERRPRDEQNDSITACSNAGCISVAG